MDSSPRQRQQAAAGLDRLASLVRAQAWRNDATPSLPPTQVAVLRMLAGAAGVRASQIAERLGVSAASLSDSIKALEGKDWIVRVPDPQDGRASLIRLTAKGRGLAQRINHPERGMSALLRDLDADDVGQLLRVTQLLVAQAQQQGLATGLRTCLGCRYFQPYANGDDQRPHICGFLQTAFGDPDLRVECAEQEPAEAYVLAENQQRFRQKTPP